MRKHQISQVHFPLSKLHHKPWTWTASIPLLTSFMTMRIITAVNWSERMSYLMEKKQMLKPWTSWQTWGTVPPWRRWERPDNSRWLILNWILSATTQGVTGTSAKMWVDFWEEGMLRVLHTVLPTAPYVWKYFNICKWKISNYYFEKHWGQTLWRRDGNLWMTSCVFPTILDQAKVCFSCYFPEALNISPG